LLLLTWSVTLLATLVLLLLSLSSLALSLPVLLVLPLALKALVPRLRVSTTTVAIAPRQVRRRTGLLRFARLPHRRRRGHLHLTAAAGHALRETSRSVASPIIHR
jgi:hypothetical protein